jgi:hypothetical protein
MRQVVTWLSLVVIFEFLWCALNKGEDYRLEKAYKKADSLTPTPAKSNPWVKQYDPAACTDPYYSAQIDGKTHSGSTRTAHEIYMEKSARLNKIATDDSLEESVRVAQMKALLDEMEPLNRYRSECQWYAEPDSRPKSED